LCVVFGLDDPALITGGAHREATLYGSYCNVEFYNVSIVIGSMLSTKKMKKIRLDITGPEMVQESQNWINNKNRDTEAETLKHENMEAWSYSGDEQSL
jgi:hypothetical protein